jgi:hypothetical protein
VRLKVRVPSVGRLERHRPLLALPELAVVPEERVDQALLSEKVVSAGGASAGRGSGCGRVVVEGLSAPAMGGVVFVGRLVGESSAGDVGWWPWSRGEVSVRRGLHPRVGLEERHMGAIGVPATDICIIL